MRVMVLMKPCSTSSTRRSKDSWAIGSGSWAGGGQSTGHPPTNSTLSRGWHQKHPASPSPRSHNPNSGPSGAKLGVLWVTLLPIPKGEHRTQNKTKSQVNTNGQHPLALCYESHNKWSILQSRSSRSGNG